IAPRRLVRDEASRGESTAREEIAVARAVGQLEALAVAEEMDRVVADDVTASDTENADLVLRSGANLAVPSPQLAELRANRLGRLGKTDRGPARRVDLLPMVHLDDLDVELGTEPAQGMLEDLDEHLHAAAHVRCPKHRDFVRSASERGF